MNFKTKPYAHQTEALKISKDKEFYALFMEMGTGKSKIEIDNICYLYDKEHIDSVLIVAPKGVYSTWFRKEIPTHIWDTTKYKMAIYSASMRIKERDALDALMKTDDCLRILIMNVESMATRKGQELTYNFVSNGHEALMIIDESTSIKNYRSKRAKGCHAIGAHCKMRRILTGTPITNSPLDLYSQCEFLKKGASGFSSYFAFKHNYAIQEKMILGNRSFDKIIGYRNHQQLADCISRFSYRAIKEECLDLPDKIYMTREVQLSQEQKLMYMTLKHESLIMLGDGILTSNNALTTLIKLQQIVCGHVKDDHGNTVVIPNNRLKELEMAISEVSGNKVIIWCNFQKDVELIYEMLKNRFESSYSVKYYGLTPDKEREEALDKFESDPECKFFIGTPHCGGKGLTLNSASYVIYYSNSFKLEDRLQSEDRCHRIGQESNVTYIDLITPKTVDEKIAKALKEKHNLAERILQNVKSFEDFI